ncbi:MAG: class I SAM-dependent methyltransferase [Planctomycetota bacterium]
MTTIQEHDRQVLCRRLADAAFAGVGIEVGVQSGRFSGQLLRSSQVKHLHLVDCWCTHENPDGSGSETQADHDRHYKRAMAEVQKSRSRNQEVSVHRGFTADVLPGLPFGTFDWAYIDAMHTYDGCLADLEATERLIRPGGLIAGHDYEQGTEWARRVQCGVVDAVADFLKNRPNWVLEAVYEDSFRNNSYVLAHRPPGEVEA